MDRVTARSASAWKFQANPALQSLPPKAPLAMPIQSLGEDHVGGARATFEDSRPWRRTVLIVFTVLTTLAAGAVMARLLAPGGYTLPDVAMLALFGLLFAWVSFAFASAVAGFMAMWPVRVPEPWKPQPIIFSKTALLLPTYNEEPGRILAAVQAIYEDLEAQAVAELYDIFVLSDTRDAAIARAEVTGVLRLRLRLNAAERIFYRRRPVNLDRKAGNVADWVMNFGGAYESMIILDADSLMSADTIIRLTAGMERDPKAALIQTLPTVVGATTLFGRLQQFAGSIYAPLIAQGQAWWSGAEGNYWGHNAILRTRAFADCAGLPHIEGGAPFGGHIMSHDFVEAALLRRGGWAVRMAPELTGSFEESPPSMIDMAVRDRRWCQGNLQHTALLNAKGFHWVSRLHLARGVLAYLTAPLWMAFLALGGVVWMQQRHIPHSEGGPLATALFAMTMALLLIPKLMGVMLAARSRFSRKASGGVLRLAASMVTEIVLSALMAPVFMLMQSRAVADVLRGRHSGWSAQERDGTSLKLGRALKRHWLHTLIGLALGAGAYALDPVLLAWTSPVVGGLALSIPVSMITSRTDLGGLSRHLGLFLTPEETAPPAVVTRANALRAQYDAERETRSQIDRLFRAPVPMPSPATSQSPVIAQAFRSAA